MLFEKRRPDTDMISTGRAAIVIGVSVENAADLAGVITRK